MNMRCSGCNHLTEQDKQIYMDFAGLVAKKSPCNKLKVGAVIVTENSTVFTGYNETPEGTCEDEHNHTYPHVIHAEIDAIAKVAKSHETTTGARVFVTTAPCLNCASMLIKMGVKEVYYRDLYKNRDGLRLLEKHHVYVDQINSEPEPEPFRIDPMILQKQLGDSY
jgi:dCMP deaminase